MKKLLFTFLVGIALSGNGQNLVHHFAFQDTTSTGINRNYIDKVGNLTLMTQYNNGTSKTPPISMNGIQDSIGDRSIHLGSSPTAMRLVTVNPVDNSNWNGVAYSVWIRNCVDGKIAHIPSLGHYINVSAGGAVDVSYNVNSSFPLSTTKSLNDGLWHHVVAQNDGSTTSIYVDGILDNSVSETLSTSTTVDPYAQLSVGASRYYYNSILSGQIDELQIFDDALSPTQIDSLFKSFKQGAELYKEVAYHFDGSISDSSRNQIDLQYNSVNRFTYASGRTANSTDSSIFAGASLATMRSNQTISSINWSSSAVSVWLKKATNGRIIEGYRLGFGLAADNSGNLEVYYDGSTSGSLLSSASAAILDTNWHHVVVQNDGNTSSIYIDGVLDASQSESFYTPSAYHEDQLIFIGASANLSGSSPSYYQYLQDGYVDDLFLYSRALHPIEINELYQFGIITGDKELPQLQVQEFDTYPNPATDFINFPEEIYQADQIKVFNVNGHVVQETARTQRLNISELDKGLYFLYVTKGEQTFRSKFIKE